jgi:hypothetical protein
MLGGESIDAANARGCSVTTLIAYIESIGQRAQRRELGYVAAIAIALLLVLTAGLAWSFLFWVPNGGMLAVARVVLAGVIVAAIAYGFWARRADAVVYIEQRVPQFSGRLRTWWDATQRGDASTLLNLLGRDAQTIAETHAASEVVSQRAIATPFGLAAVLLIALLALVFAGNAPWQLAAKRLWTGELFTATAPRIVVDPGDTVIPKGRNVVIEAQALGFNVDSMQVHALFASAPDWERASMTRLGDDKYGFVFVGVGEELEYYVGSDGLNSERHVIRVADLPRITQVSLAYEYPSWTGVEPNEELDGDVSAVAGTQVGITATADKPISEPLIVVNDEVMAGEGDGLTARGEFAVGEPGSWYIAVRHEGTLAQISDTFLINTVEDRPPEVAFTWPGHDRQATSIEEVGFRFSAEDDFVVEGLAMHYSVNGGEWVEVMLDPEHPRHDLFLEEMTLPERDDRALAPGDMISFYAEARDHTQTSKTSLYFVDVRPFDRVYRESQSSGGGGGGGGDQGGFEIAQRQREIVTATWNLVNKNVRAEGEQALADQADTLALLQRTLKEQVETLTARAEARRLTSDEEIDKFTAELKEAATYMEPAAEKLEERALRDAIEPEQRALQHLLAAEATMTDVDVSMGQSEGRGSSGRSLSELVDLEMDQERNRYETQQSPSFSEESTQDDSDWRELEELARRQEQLGERNAQEQQQSLASRWQQERLKREIERLREQLERQRQSQQGRGTQSQSLDNAIAELDRARASMEQSMQQQSGGAQSGGQASGNQQAQQAQRAAEAMRNAAEQLRENQRANLEERLSRAGRQVENLLNDQRTAIERLEEVQQETLEAARRGEGNPYRNFAMEPFVDRKRRMQEDLAEVIGDVSDVSTAVGERDPRAQQMLERALRELSEENVDERLGASADAFAIGRPLFALDNEATVERSLERFSRRLGQAQGELSEQAGGAADTSPLAEVRGLRRALEGATGGTNVGTDRGRLDSLLREAENLEFRVAEELGVGPTPDTRLDRENYVPRGTDATNNERLASLISDRLDLLEAALLNIERSPMRAQMPRDSARDSNAAAEYFRELGAGEFD